MQKYVNPIPNGGAPLHNNRLNGELQLEFWDVIEGSLSAYNADAQGVILTGCVITGSGPYAMTAGIIYLNGEFMRIPAQASFSLPQYIQPDTVVNIAKTFADGSSQTLLVNKPAKIAGTTPGSGQYVSITTVLDPDDRRFKGTWKSLTLINGWAVANSSNPRYRISLGKVEFRGQLDGTAATSSLITAAGTFPSAGYNVGMPSNRLHVSTLVTDACTVSADTSGRLSSANDGFSSVLYLDGLQYFI